MSDYNQGSAAGGMSSGDGQTTKVGAKRTLSAKDRAVLCGALCNCKRIGVMTVNGRVQRQRCVQMRIDALNDASRQSTGYPTQYRPEQPYNMKTKPPSPIMDSDDSLEPVSNLREWIASFWPGGRASYKPGIGNTRRPDVVIVNDPSRPPTQDNLQWVVEMKFPPDDYSTRQEADYKRIAGDPGKLIRIGPAECGCGDDQSSGKTSALPQIVPSPSTSTDTDDLLDAAGLKPKSTGVTLPGGGTLPGGATSPSSLPAYFGY